MSRDTFVQELGPEHPYLAIPLQGLADLALEQKNYEHAQRWRCAACKCRFWVARHRSSPNYKASSAMTYIEQVRAPVLILSGRNDYRSSAGPIEMYEQKMKEQGKAIEVVWFDTGYISAVLQAELGITYQDTNCVLPPKCLANRCPKKGRDGPTSGLSMEAALQTEADSFQVWMCCPNVKIYNRESHPFQKEERSYVHRTQQTTRAALERGDLAQTQREHC